MERTSAFEVKTADQEQEGAAAERGGLEVLGDLETNQRKVKTYLFLLDLIAQDKLRLPKDIECFFKPSFYPSNGGDNAILENAGRTANLTDKEDNQFTKKDVTALEYTPEQEELLRSFGTLKEEYAKEQTESDQKIKSVVFFLDLIAQDKLISPKDIECFFKPSFYPSNGGDNAVLENTARTANLNDKEGNGFSRRDVEKLQTTPEEQLIFSDLAKARSEAFDKKDALEKVTQTTEFFVDLLAEEKLQSPQDIECFFRPKFYPSTAANAVLEDAAGTANFRDKAGNEFTRKQVESLKLEDGDKKLIRDLSGFLSDPKIPVEIKENLRRFVGNPDASSLGRMQQVMTTSGEQEVEERINVWTQEFSAVQRRRAFEKAFYDSYALGDSFEKMLIQLSQYENANQSDTELVGQLREVAFNRRRLTILDSVAKSFSANGDVDDALEQLGLLAKSPSAKDREAAQVIAESVCIKEIRDYKNRVVGLINENISPEDLRIAVESLPLRPSIGKANYVEAVADLREKVFLQVAEISNIRRIKNVNAIRESFATQEDPEKVILTIKELPGETKEDIETKNALFDAYKNYVAANRPDIYDARFSDEIAAEIKKELDAKFLNSELGINKQAFNYVRNRFISTIYPLIESFRGDPTTAETLKEFLDVEVENGVVTSQRNKYTQRLSVLQAQRPLTDAETNYLQSVELLSVFNPYLVGAVYANQGVTSAFLMHHFDTLSENTKAELKDGDYVPLVQIGLGPNGLASLGEVVRNNPDLASNMLLVDGGRQPGGPFAIPRGPAWELNSANRRGATGPTLPQKPDSEKEKKSVRGYGSPLRWYPGERSGDSSVRAGSINVTVDYLPTPDDLSSARYPTNEELQILLSLQAAMLAKRVALETRVVSVEPNPDPHGKGDKIVTLQMQDGDDIRTVKLTTDAVFTASGLGEPNWGFKLEGSKAEKVINETKDIEGFPKVSRTLEAFNAFSDRSKETYSPGKTLVVYGKGNSADTIIELVGNIFQSGNPRVRDVTKIYLVCEGDLSARPRYALINDLKPRNGRGNLIEFVQTRVTDIDFATNEEDVEKRKLKILNQEGQTIVDAQGKPIIADSVIAATGFRPNADSVFASYLDKDQSFRDLDAKSPKEPIVLPTNEDVPVGESLKKDPNIVFLGTASRPFLDKNVDKLGQLPREAREALLRNGAENAVAIGFRAPDTQAAVNIWLNSRKIDVPKQSEKPRTVVPLEGDVKSGSEIELLNTVDPEDFSIPNNIPDENLFLSPLLAYSVGNKIEISTGENQKTFTGTISFDCKLDSKSGNLSLLFNGGDVDSISSQLLDVVVDTCQDVDFQRYALNALKKKRKNPKLDLVISFKNGKMNPTETYVQD